MVQGTQRDDAGSEARSQQVRQVVQDCLQRRAAGESLSDESIIDAHPDLMPGLGEELRKLRLIAAAWQKAEQDSSGDVDGGTGTRRGLQVRCPHCHTPVEMVADTPFTEITCSTCGSSFSLAGDETVTRRAASITTIGHFELVERLGVGGFGTVWKARDTELDRTVTVKIPRAGQLDGIETEQFLREARTAAQLKHPGIVSVHEVGRDGETVYIVSDLVRGLSLADWLTGQRPTASETAELCVKIAEALHHAHQAGVVHRDLKPANVMIDADGQPHIMDFGLAKREAGEITLTTDGQVLGTPAYMPPEQAEGKAHQVDGRSDVYSLGVILFELLTGERPFRGNARMLIHQVIHDEPPSPRKLNGTIPRDLETICLKCMEKARDRRYGSAEELAEELRRFLRGEPIHARPIGPGARVWRWCKRKPLVAGLTAAVTGLLLFLAVAGPIVAVGQASLAAKEAEARGKAVQAAQTAEEAQRQTEQHVYVAHMNLAQHAWQAADVGRMLELLTHHRHKPSERRDLRGFDWYYLWGLCHRERLTVDRFKSRIGAFALSADGHWAAMAEGHIDVPFVGSKEATLWNARTWQQVATLRGHEGPIHSLAFSPTEKVVATAGWDGTVKLWDVPSGNLRATVPGVLSGLPACLAFSPDGRMLATAGGVLGRVGRFALWETATLLHAAPSAIVTGPAFRGHSGWIQCVAFSPDNRTLVTGSQDNTAILWDIAAGKARATLGHDGGVLSAAFSPAGELLATGSFDGAISFWDPATGTMTRRVPAHDGGVYAVAFSPDGEVLASGSQDSSVKLWYLGREFRQVLSFKGHRAPVVSAAFSPDGRSLMTAGLDSTVKVWDVDLEKTQPRFHGDAMTIRSLACSPDGNLVAAGGMDGRLKLWDLDTHRRRKVLKVRMGPVVAIAFSPDSVLLAASSETGVKIFEIDADRPPNEISIDAAAYSLAFSPDGGLLAIGTGGRLPPSEGTGTVILWDVKSGQRLDTLEGHDQAVMCVAFAPDGELLVSGGWDRKLILWDVATRTERGTLQGHYRGVLCAAFAPDGKMLASAGLDTTVKVWDVATQEAVATLRGHRYRINSLAFSPDGGTLVSGAGAMRSFSSELRRWKIADQPDGAPSFAEQRFNDSVKTDGGVSGVAFSPDGNLLMTGSYDKSLHLWDATTGKLNTTLQADETDRVHFVGLSPKGETLVSVSTKSVKTWNATTGREQATFKAADLVGVEEELGPPKILSAALSPDGKSLALGSGFTMSKIDLHKVSLADPSSLRRAITEPQTPAKGVALIVDPASGEVVSRFDDLSGPVRTAAFSPDGRILALGDGELVRLRVLGKETEWTMLEGHSADLLSLAFSPDGKLLASAGDDKTVRLWDVDSHTQVASLQGHQGRVGSLAFSPDGKTLASSSGDGTVRLWDVDGRRMHTTLRSRQGQVFAVAFSPDGKTLVTASGDYLKPTQPGEVRLWDPITGQESIALSGSKGFVFAIGFSADGKTLATAGGPRGYETGPGFVDLWHAAGKQEQLQNRLRFARHLPKSTSTHIDLRSKANRKLDEGTPVKSEDSHLEELPQGEQQLAGVRFRIGDGLVQLGGKGLPARPERVGGIPVNTTFTKLYLLHGTQFGAGKYIVADGTLIGHYDVHYDDDTVETIPIVYGEDLRDWWNHDGSRPVSRGKVAWTGQSPATRRYNRTLRLYLTTWENPWPDKKVNTIDYVSTNTGAAPFCVAMTAEEVGGNEQTPVHEADLDEAEKATSPSDGP